MRMFELYPPDKKIELGRYAFTAENITRFREKFDPGALFFDPSRSDLQNPLRKRASGWHVASAWMRTFMEYRDEEARQLALSDEMAPMFGPSPGVKNLTWRKPVFEGHVVSYFVTFLGTRPLLSRPGRHLNRMFCEGYEGSEHPVISFESSVLEFDEL